MTIKKKAGISGIPISEINYDPTLVQKNMPKYVLLKDDL